MPFVRYCTPDGNYRGSVNFKTTTRAAEMIPRIQARGYLVEIPLHQVPPVADSLLELADRVTPGGPLIWPGRSED